MNYFFIILSVFKIVISVTPVSANTASHIFANPNTLNKSIITLTDNANIKFCLIICFVNLEILIACGIFLNHPSSIQHHLPLLQSLFLHHP